MNGFKIIAIKPLKGCNQEYLKILKEDVIYFFYHNYSIDNRDKITVTDVLPNNFYNVRGIDVNISAIVGKNGSGKSTIIELLFRAINNLAYGQDGITAELNKIPKLKVDLYFQTDRFYKVRFNDSSIAAFAYDKFGNKLPTKLKDFGLRHFFYTIAVNYSHYAYNTNDLSDEVNWLDGLFHKNDGYQTPLVINPVRRGGDIDINNENHLVKSRLIGNLLRSKTNDDFSFRKLTDKLEATSLRLTLNKSKRTSVLYELSKSGTSTEKITIDNLNFSLDNALNKLDKAYSFNYKGIDKDKYQLALDYLIYKMVSIATKYDNYLTYFSRDGRAFYPHKFDRFIQELIEDESHITFKLKQTLNFLRYQHIEFKDQTIDLSDLSTKISNLKTRRKRLAIIEFIPPPIFSIDILLKTQDDGDKPIEFKKLSSGEKQMIYSVSSLLYHLINLNSITAGRKGRIGFRYINIVLEEIELYFHPEMQRTYINYILNSISKLELRRIKAINFCFVTHSPFILSDIPNSNVLFLDDDGIPKLSQDQRKTFGGNIHELLADSFFLGNGFMGEFAKRKIESIIQRLKNDNHRDIFKEIQVIGEPFLKKKLEEMYHAKNSTQKRIAELKNELAKLEGK